MVWHVPATGVRRVVPFESREVPTVQTSNPAFSEAVFSDFASQSAAPAWAGEEARVQTMTIQGTTSKCLLSLAVLTGAGAWTWSLAASGTNVLPWVIGGVLVGTILAFATIFIPKIAPYTTLPYAAAEGLALGGISQFFDATYSGIVMNAILLTLAILFVMLALYTSRIIRVTDKLRIAIVAATGAILLVYVLTWILAMFGVGIPYIHSNGLIGIGFSLFVVGIAAFNLLLDFDFIERGERAGLPKSMEWYGTLGLLITLVWLYLSILRLLAKLQER